RPPSPGSAATASCPTCQRSSAAWSGSTPPGRPWTSRSRRPAGSPGGSIVGTMTAGLLERDAELRRLRETLRGAVQGRGSVVLVSGEAGIGKTSLVRAFAREASGSARVLVGACDDLVTPRTLGPFRDSYAGSW